MRKSPVIKAIALILAALSCVLSFGFFVAGTWLYNANLYHDDTAALLERIERYRAENLASNLANRYATQSLNTVSASVLDAIGNDYSDEAISQRVYLSKESWIYTIRGYDNVILESTVSEDTAGMHSFTFTVSGTYLVPATIYDDDVSIYVDGDYQYFAYMQSQDYNITVYLTDNAVTAIYGLPITAISQLYQQRYSVITGLALSLLLFAACIFYLCIAAGHSKKYDHICPGGLNRLPLDVYGLAVVFLVFALLDIAFDGIFSNLFYYPGNEVATEKVLEIIATTGIFLIIGLLAAAFVFALAAQLKADDRFWLKNTLLYRLVAFLWKLIYRGIQLSTRLISMLPLIAQWLLAGLGVMVLLFISILFRSEFLFILAILLNICIVIYSGFAYGKLLQGVQKMAQGDLNGKISSKYLFGTFRDFSAHLNQLSDVTVAAADAHLRSERMKTELITNVSHDIKTPLTSIINYTDLLRTAQDGDTREEYLQILENQGLRLKRLIEDLTDLSRASSGNIQADMKPMDAAEALKQALGEFSDKLSAAQLQVCTKFPDASVRIAADGRLFWRVMSNLIGNVVKYAQPGTRVYVILTAGESTAQISVKNISREPLNIRAEELMERFVRGDQSRNTEGSGLGLSIASSLMDVQKGHLDVRIDADLFTATLTFLKADLF